MAVNLNTSLTGLFMLPDIKKVTNILVQAGTEELMPRFRKVSRQYKADASVITEADHAVQDCIASALNENWPEIEFLGEEMPEEDHQAALQGEGRVWCLDPLDGTSNFANGIPYFCISLALIDKGRVVQGVIYDPNRDECFTADEHHPAMLNGSILELNNSGLGLKQTAAVVDFKRLSKGLRSKIVEDMPYGSQRSFGSVALDWCWLAAERGHVYVHGSQKIWDYAAGHYIFERAGGYSQTLEGEAVFSRSLEVRSAVAAIDRPLYEAWVSYLETAQDSD